MKFTIKKIGVISVDSGTIYVGDPCYIETQQPMNRDFREWSQKMCIAYEKNQSAAQLNLHAGSDHEFPGLGVVSRTLYGDGEYTVYGMYAGKDTRPSAVIIDFCGRFSHGDQMNSK